VGLTEKSHSINWVMRELVEGYHISREEVLVVGDEFGPVAGFSGSDAKMVTSHSKGAVFLSVGAEPEGVPSGIIHLGGGPARFREVLRSQVALQERLDGHADGVWSDMPASPTRDAGWLLVDEGFNLAREHEIESLFAVSNGYVGMRAVLAERSKMSSPGTFLAGVFAIAHKSDSIPELAVAPDWMHLNIAVDGRELHLEEGEVLEHRRTLDMRQGILWRQWRHRDSAGRVTRLRFLRLASLADRHVLLQSVTLMPENYSGRVSLESIIEQPFEGTGLFSPTEANAISVSHLQNGDGSLPGPATVELEIRTAGTGVTIAMASFSAFRTEEGELIEQSVEREEGRVVGVASWEAEIGVTYCLDRVMCIHTSRDSRRPAQASARHLGRISKEGIASVVKAHVKAWESRWEASAVEVGGDDEAKRSLRFAGYHLISAANPEDERVSVGARALTGEAYKGHVFWDTEIFMLPFYIFTDPPSARGLLMYRYHTLPAARKKASALSYRGALYAWESADKGEETTPPFVLAPNGEVIRILSGEQEHHISADVAFGVWQYWEATADDSFFLVAGAEILLETARFWASRGKIEEDGCYHVRKVVGPDEYHAGVDDNAYTNLMARWNLERGAEAARILKERWPEPWQKIVERMRIASGEPAEWLRLAEAMYAGLDSKSGLLEQFQGYFGLEEIDLVPYEQRSVPMDVLLGHERIAMSKVIKQADVVMLICLLWDWFAPAVREANFRFYEPRTGHGSSLSPSIHALVAARLGDIPLAQKYFQQAAEVDLANNMGNAASGVHAAALGGLWQASVFGLAGMRLAPDGLAFDPHLLPGWSNLRFSVQWRGRRLQVAIEQESQTIEIEIGGGAALLVALSEQPAVIMAPGRRYLARHEVGGWGEWRELRAS
ncbi:MAG: glycosyl hydrolase family 65 protein, partial [Dehalococcoidia bacterium]|nr:glycosyl hydrolase family 65 protein [Dehalococcoidia bacterium]